MTNPRREKKRPKALVRVSRLLGRQAAQDMLHAASAAPGTAQDDCMSMKPGQLDQFVRVADIAEQLNVNVRTVRRWISEGALPSAKVGGARLVAIADLQALLTRATGSGPKPD